LENQDFQLYISGISAAIIAKELIWGLISDFKGRGFISRTQEFNYEPDKLAEYLVCEFDID
jgi:hypothetical protein